MNEETIKHLEFLQNVITRMNANSFLIKGWTVTIIAALLVFGAKDQELSFVIIGLIPIVIFWALDGYYLSQERKYRGLYEGVISEEEEVSLFDMNASKYKKNNGRSTSFFASVFSKTICPFYLALIVVSGLIIYLNGLVNCS